MAEEKCCNEGIIYGLFPHVGCVAFIFASIFGSTVLMQYFKPLLMSRNIFYYLILISVGFATISSLFYLKKHKSLSLSGVRKKKGYLFTMYGSTIGVNVFLFFFVFPFLANFTGASVVDPSGLYFMSLQVDIPCPGHAPLISSEVSGVEGVEGVEYSFPNKFDVYYKGGVRSEILGLDVFDEYVADVILEGFVDDIVRESIK